MSAIKRFVYSNERGYRQLKPETNFDSYKIKYPSAIICRKPSLKKLEEWENESYCLTPCGCTVEPDGYCGHDRPSWLIISGMI